MNAAVEQVVGLWGMLVASWWVNGFDHTSDMPDLPLRRLAERQSWMHQYDPGLVLAMRES